MVGEKSSSLKNRFLCITRKLIIEGELYKAIKIGKTQQNTIVLHFPLLNRIEWYFGHDAGQELGQELGCHPGNADQYTWGSLDLPCLLVNRCQEATGGSPFITL